MKDGLKIHQKAGGLFLKSFRHIRPVEGHLAFEGSSSRRKPVEGPLAIDAL